MDKKYSSEAELIKCISKMGVAIRSIYCVRHMVPFETRINFLRKLVLSHLSFSSAFFQSLPMSQIDR